MKNIQQIHMYSDYEERKKMGNRTNSRNIHKSQNVEAAYYDENGPI